MKCTKQHVLNTFQQIRYNFRKQRFLSPFFLECEYAEFFYLIVRDLVAEPDEDVQTMVAGLLEKALQDSRKEICRLLDRNTPDGTTIWELLEHEMPILRKHQIAYNRQVPGSGPKGILAGQWYDYNHWVVAVSFWKGFVLSQKSGFAVNPIEYDITTQKLAVDHTKVLCAMRAKFEEIGSPFVASRNYRDAIKINPIAAWMRWKQTQCNA